MLKPFSHSRQSALARTASRIALVAALAIPATAIAAPPTDDPAAIPAVSASAESTSEAPVALISGFGVGLAVDPAAARPFHPVDGAVDYGDAEAGFGNERGRPHEGQDIFAPAGTPVISPTETVVVETGAAGTTAATGLRSTTPPRTGPSSTSTCSSLPR